MDNAHALLSRYFGFDQFREGQHEVVQNILNGHSAAAIFPTGSGKSLCYQLPALALPHLTLVVSPLLALMDDQLQFLQNRGIAAASIDSTQTNEQASAVIEGVTAGRIKILMISVERLNNERFRRFIASVPISMLVIDEAHCISEWGHNFRPDYLKLPAYQRQLKIPQVLLLTATATPKVIEDMGKKFSIERQCVTLTGFYRPNLNLQAVGIPSCDKLSYLYQWLEAKKGLSGIVYVTLQQTAEFVANELVKAGFAALAYHAGMDSDRRKIIQCQFMKGEVPIIVATIAFGMGIDKSDIRFVAHYDLPKSIENYAQEIGRAGRDGLSSDCLVLANRDNLNVLENFVYGDTPELSAIEFVIKEIKRDSQNNGVWELMLNPLSSASNIRILSLKTLLVYLEMLKVLKPKYSYFAEYRFKLLCPIEELLAKFDPDRQVFINAVIDSSQKAKLWYSANFEVLEQKVPNSRDRAIKALDYLHQKQLIELQSKQLTQVYQVFSDNLDDSIALKLFNRFSVKEQSEIRRINQLVDYFDSESCLSLQLAQYFADPRLTQPCGHCSVCSGHSAKLPPSVILRPLNQFDFNELCNEAINRLGKHLTPVLLTRFLCGLTTPIFTKLKMRQVKGFSRFEQYRFADVLLWAEANLPSSSC
ncbi:RecQ family ATP-dependent DNA helicase [Shewanella schlegeliana]|uniref:ATP-dependent DNA helicase RecQ n=1 Tax=Shewanella schlegeliana TaxID=190308 RepID=A0ABS1SZD1_9GAMM|nr:ATP-dependent DNA helicase RecQ [Shewanella schlegeliana]MBL4913888.1 RecQ family ATP-dependent DNA helicase [Shewanella schlegeliana]MCL1108728.1 RecQ family ATP-dependent DNA helicase [Shewanella schlegeliana]GIU26287.1 ATP-dependent DNA helicase RecQ [Shewanella schlegeliana]